MALMLGGSAVLDALDAYSDVDLGPLLAMRDGRRPQGVRRLEGHVHGPQRVLLQRTVGTHSRAACVDALRAAVDLYRELRDGAGHGPPVRRTAAEAVAVAYLDEKAGG